MEPGIARGLSLPVATTASRPQASTSSAEAQTTAAVPAAGQGESASSFKRNTAQEPRFRDIVEKAATHSQLVVDEDPASQSMVFRSIDTGSGNVMHQYPSESILKLRAYVSEATKMFMDAKLKRDV